MIEPLQIGEYIRQPACPECGACMDGGGAIGTGEDGARKGQYEGYKNASNRNIIKVPILPIVCIKVGLTKPEGVPIQPCEASQSIRVLVRSHCNINRRWVGTLGK